MFKISKYVDSEKENVNVNSLDIEINGKKKKTLQIEVNGERDDDNYTLSFIFSNIDGIFKMSIGESVCLSDEYLLFGETMFTYNGLTYLDTSINDIDIFRIDEENYEFNINFDTADYNGIVCFECNIGKYL